MKYLWLCLLALWGIPPAMAQLSPPTDTVYMSGLTGAGALSDTDQFYVCQDSVSHCPHGGANILAGTNTQLTTYFRSKLSATAPLAYNSSTGAFSLTGPSNLTTFTANAIPKGAGASPMVPSALSDNGTIVSSTESIDATTMAYAVERPNALSTGTTANKLAKLTGAGTAVLATTSDTGGNVLGIVVGGAGTSGNAQIAVSGQATCVFDGGTTANDFVQVSISVNGDCHDGGSSFPTTGGQILGFVLSTNASGGSYSILVVPPTIIPASGGSNYPAITTVTKTGPYTITSADNGTCFDNAGASSIVAFTLPTLGVGLNFCFTVMTATAGTVGIEVLTPGGSGAKIALAPSVSAANGNIQDTTLYESVSLIAEPAGSPTTWVARSSTGSNWIVN
jgi:hypothetical protein